MIDRSYLPFQSAREYQDRKMAKWLGFFLSEHTTALSDAFTHITFFSEMPLTEKIRLLEQVYANQTAIKISVKNQKTIDDYYGSVSDIDKNQLTFKTNTAYLKLDLDNILTIKQAKEEDDESI
ncbi:hypothetical protein [Streptococcus pacificus]|uniref:YolD-like protein n=1 Tax=Streptococcus pacificus TaxID=2740577 RepID=A0ABS0ZJN2_9STRE|nr:hypothetical protein [Streptococcus pacificus]MBJ8326215.1 hypothetical protein [Streptococcus pacificus]